jgi:hypothetical protein
MANTSPEESCGPGGAWVEVEEGEWTVAYRLVPSPAGPEIAELRVFPAAGREAPGLWSGDVATVPSGGLTSAVLRLVRLRAHRPAIDNEISQNPALNAVPDQLVDDVFYLRAQVPPQGLARRDDLFYALLSRIYLSLLEVGERKPNQAIGSMINRKSSFVREALRHARLRGFLSSSPQPRVAGGELTDKAKEVLDKLPPMSGGRE